MSVNVYDGLMPSADSGTVPWRELYGGHYYINVQAPDFYFVNGNTNLACQAWLGQQWKPCIKSVTSEIKTKRVFYACLFDMNLVNLVYTKKAQISELYPPHLAHIKSFSQFFE